MSDKLKDMRQNSRGMKVPITILYSVIHLQAYSGYSYLSIHAAWFLKLAWHIIIWCQFKI